MANDWLPRPRAAQIELAKRWSPHINTQKTTWKIPQQDIARLDAAITCVDEVQDSFDHNASPGNRAEIRDVEEDLAQRHRGWRVIRMLRVSLILVLNVNKIKQE